MKRNPIILLLAIIATISGYLISKATLLGRIGISLFYKEYAFMKIWWQAAFVVFITFALLLTIHGIIQKRAKRTTAIVAHIVSLVIAVVGLYLTYHDFRHDLSHRLMGERFHLGFYLFWIGWMIVCVYYLQAQRLSKPPTTTADNTDAADI